MEYVAFIRAYRTKHAYCIFSVSSGPLVFVDAAGEKEISVFNSQEHQAVTDVEWDPTGRYVVSYVSSWSAASRGVDFGYNMWNFQGRMLQRRPMDRFCAFAWRPRPQPIITEAKIKVTEVFQCCVHCFLMDYILQEVKKDMKKYAAMFEEKDKLVLSKASKVRLLYIFDSFGRQPPPFPFLQEIVEKRRSQMDEFAKWRNERRQEWQNERQERIKLRGGMSMLA